MSTSGAAKTCMTVAGIAVVLVIVAMVYRFRSASPPSGFTSGGGAGGLVAVSDCRTERAGGPCMTRPGKGSGEGLCPPLDCCKKPPKRRCHTPPEPPCVEPPMPPLPPRDPCYKPDKARGESLCPRDLCRSWCWDAIAVEEAQGLASASATGFDNSDPADQSLNAALFGGAD
jgi:hypothetical protein